MENQLLRTFGQIDIYLFDQLLKGRFDACQTILDAGCGGGRNLVYFLQQPVQVYGVDSSAEAVAEVQHLAQTLAAHLPADNFRVAALEELPYPDGYFDLVICSAVLHFARDGRHFGQMVQELGRVLKPGGFLFARLASDIGLEDRVQAIGNGRYLLPDGSVRFLVNQDDLLHYTAVLGGQLFEPLKTTNVQNQRCMTTWCVQKR